MQYDVFWFEVIRSYRVTSITTSLQADQRAAGTTLVKARLCAVLLQSSSATHPASDRTLSVVQVAANTPVQQA
jgi:hypothetical protein